MLVVLFFGRSYFGILPGLLSPRTVAYQAPKIPADFPNDVPVFPNFQLDDVEMVAGAKVLDLTAKSDPQSVLVYYQQQLEAYGWKVTAPTREETEDGDGIGIAAEKNGRQVAVVVTPLKDGESAVQQMVR
jgi:hypothetical protein